MIQNKMQTGLELISRGKYREAVQVYDEIWNFSREHDIRADLAQCESMLGLAHRSLGNSEGALRWFQASLSTAQQMGQVGLEVEARISLSSHFRQQNDLKTALEHLERAKVMAENTGNIAQQASVQGHLGQLCMSSDKNAALRHFEQSAKFRTKQARSPIRDPEAAAAGQRGVVISGQEAL
ncbi:hypothetical protein CYMTET_50949 [Cymbomonas tetramitiformis]|uniref:Tetratricopeptide repeat protein 29 n=1 Tax=Cymbomonas tetramitiformis TaxID=36881 RepID=A0AAE0BM09_9CHLO|nr:hypothetical protein CYMTET_50949 [Cymbomonas tetramitiformis]